MKKFEISEHKTLNEFEINGQSSQYESPEYKILENLYRIHKDIELVQGGIMSNLSADDIMPSKIPNSCVWPIMVRARVYKKLDECFGGYNFFDAPNKNNNTIDYMAGDSRLWSYSEKLIQPSIYEAFAELAGYRGEIAGGFCKKIDDIFAVIKSIEIEENSSKTEYVKRVLLELQKKDMSQYGTVFCSIWVKVFEGMDCFSWSQTSEYLRTQKLPSFIKDKKIEEVIKFIDTFTEIFKEAKYGNNDKKRADYIGENIVQNRAIHNIIGADVVDAFETEISSHWQR